VPTDDPRFTRGGLGGWGIPLPPPPAAPPPPPTGGGARRGGTRVRRPMAPLLPSPSPPAPPPGPHISPAPVGPDLGMAHPGLYRPPGAPAPPGAAAQALPDIAQILQPIQEARAGMGLPAFGAPGLLPIHEALWQQVMGGGQRPSPTNEPIDVQLRAGAGQAPGEGGIPGFPFVFPEDFYRQLQRFGTYQGRGPGAIRFRL
jgi:hypothetical protein